MRERKRGKRSGQVEKEVDEEYKVEEEEVNADMTVKRRWMIRR